METIEVLRRLDKETEGSVYLVGGFVRDFLRNKRNDDLDIVIRNITLEKVLDFLKPHGKTEEIKLSSKGNKFSSIDIILFRAFKDREGMQAQMTLARRGKKVLLVDLDPQANLTMCMGYDAPDDLPHTIADLYMEHIQDVFKLTPEEYLLHVEGCDLLPSSIQLAGIEPSLINALARE